MSILLSTIEQEPIPKTTLAFFLRNNQNRYHSFLLRVFNASGLSQKTIADRLGKEPAQINRLLSAAGNLTINTVTSLLLAMGFDLDDPSSTPIAKLVAGAEVETSRPGDTSGRLVAQRPQIPKLSNFDFRKLGQNDSSEQAAQP